MVTIDGLLTGRGAEYELHKTDHHHMALGPDADFEAAAATLSNAELCHYIGVLLLAGPYTMDVGVTRAGKAATAAITLNKRIDLPEGSTKGDTFGAMVNGDPDAARLFVAMRADDDSIEDVLAAAPTTAVCTVVGALFATHFPGIKDFVVIARNVLSGRELQGGASPTLQ